MSLEPSRPVLEPGVLPLFWGAPAVTTGGAGAREPFLVHPYNRDLFVIRQAAETHFEKPFLYLVIGNDLAMLIDTGAPGVDVEAMASGVLGEWAARTARRLPPLLVTHTHGHSDHIAGDGQFVGRPHTTLVGTSIEEVVRFFGIDDWPEGIGQVDLGGRVLDVLPIPGHEPASVAFYDRRTGLLLSGDLIYPGRLYVRDPHAFRASVRRLVAFTATRPVAHILGAHIENQRTPYLDYPEGTVDQPDEHELPLGRAHLLELDAVLASLDLDRLPRLSLRDFTIWPVEGSAT